MSDMVSAVHCYFRPDSFPPRELLFGLKKPGGNGLWFMQVLRCFKQTGIDGTFQTTGELVSGRDNGPTFNASQEHGLFRALSYQFQGFRTLNFKQAIGV